MYIINKDYFQDERLIANLNGTNGDVLIRLEKLIDRVCRKTLRDALGILEFTELNGFILPNGNLNPAAPVKWQNFVNGKTYTDGRYWIGLIQTYGTAKESLLADLVYSKWLQMEQTKQSGVGEAVVLPKNAIVVDAKPKIVNYYNKFVEAHQGYVCPEHIGRTMLYNGVPFTDWLGTNYENAKQMTLVDYLREEFPNVEPIMYEFKDRFFN